MNHLMGGRIRLLAGILSIAMLGTGLACARVGVSRSGDTSARSAPVSTRTIYTRSDTVRPRRVPNYAAQDSARRATVATLLRELAGRENEPAGKVFKNVQLHKDMPVREFLAKMDSQYGRGTGSTCTGCHIPGRWENDSLKNKVISRQMETMTRTIQAGHLEKVKELDEDFPTASCVMCHRGALHMPNVMSVPKN